MTGFDLQKKLAASASTAVGAVSKTIKPAADRKRKNDRNDAEFLARLLSVGNVTEVGPDDECEAARDLTSWARWRRSRGGRSIQAERCSRKFLLRHAVRRDQPVGCARKKNLPRPLGIKSVSFAERADSAGPTTSTG